jgi:uncharacterized protein YgbK (DUF1537 family)
LAVDAGALHDVRIIVLDDDPTGIQTVFGNLLLTEWDPPTLRRALTDDVRFFYILTNTRGMTARDAQKTIHSATAAVLEANRTLNHRLIFISRSDSTLRSHFPLEIDEIRACLMAAGRSEPDAFFLVPAFIEGGRVTIDDTHYLREDGRLIPTAETEFARDSVFGYPTSHLPGYIEYKTAGRVPAPSVRSISLEMIRSWPTPALKQWLLNLQHGTWCVVNAETYDDLHRFTSIVRELLASGRSFMFQSAASLVKSLTETPDRPLLDRAIVPATGPGLVIVGSHVTKTTRQLEELLSESNAVGIEVDVKEILQSPDLAMSRIVDQTNATFRLGRHPVVFTSRREMKFESTAERMAAGHTTSHFLSRIVREVKFKPSFIIAKGGITSHDVLVHGLQIKSARVAGQFAPGVPVVTLPAEHRFAGIPYVIFPGNVGGPTALRDVFKILTGET